MAGPSVLLAGIGGAGVAIAGWSRALHLRDIAYLAIDSDREALAASGIAREIPLRPAQDASPGATFSARQAQAIAQAAAAAEICIVVAGLGGRTASRASPALARIARAHRSKVLTIAVLPSEMEPAATQTRAGRALSRLAKTSDVLFVLPLTLLSLADCDPGDQDDRTRQLYDWADRIIDLATAPAAINLILRACAHNAPGEAALGLFRRMVVPHFGEGLADRLVQDTGLLPAQFDRAREATLVVRGSAPGPYSMGTILFEASRVFPDDIAIDCIARPTAMPGETVGVELVSFCPAPATMAEEFSLAGASPWQPLMPWREPDAPPITAAYRGLFGARLEAGPRSWPEPAATMPAARAVRHVSRRWNQLRREPPFSAGGLMEWLDRALGELETNLAAAWSAARRRPDNVGDRSRLGRMLHTPAHLAGALWALPRESDLRDWRSVAALIALALLPLGIATVAVNNLGAISRSNTLIRNEPAAVLDRFIERDLKRLAEAGAATPLTQMDFSQLGPAAQLPSPMAAHLDKWAAGKSFLNLHRFMEPRVPYAFINAADPRLRGQVRLVSDFAGQNTESRIQALNALGIFPNLAQLADSGAGVDASEAAVEMDELYAAAEQKLDFENAARFAGCATVRDAVTRRFLLKRLSPKRISLSYVHYVLELAFSTPGDCTANLRRAVAGLTALKAFKGISYVSSGGGEEEEEEEEGKSGEETGQRTYAVVAPRSILAPADPSTDLGVYVAGLRAFYLLDFAAAEALFAKLSASANPVAAATGSFLTARTIFWRHEFARGAYRPDLYPPWRHLGVGYPEDDYSGATRDDGSEAADNIPRCDGAASPTSHCTYATPRQPVPARNVPPSAADRARLKAINDRLARFPVVDPRYLRRYQGEFVEVVSNREFDE